MARCPQPTLTGRFAWALSHVKGAYSLVMTSEDRLVAARDPFGFRPLILGRLRSSPRSYVVASETCAFDLIEAEAIRDVEPGEILTIEGETLRSERIPSEPKRFCVFEHVYFARPDSRINGQGVYELRLRMGSVLAREAPVDNADMVIPVPDSGVVAALGYARAADIPFEMGLIRNHYVGRTFIEPKDSIRHFGVKLKLNPVPGLLEGKKVVVVDDSIVRGTTSRKIVKMIREAGAAEVHVRISSPPVIRPCFYGIDTPTRGELIANSHSPPEIARYITADSVAYLSPEGLTEAVRGGAGGFCSACFTGDYPVPFDPPAQRRQLRLVEL
jgi:amidophosphoribosyltransferase